MTDAASELSLAERIDALCDRFEQEFRTGQTPRIERYLESTSEPLKSALFRALLELEWELRQKRGETPQLEEYASRFSDRKDDVRRILEDARSVLSSVKPSQVETSKGPSAAQRAGSAAGQTLKKLGRFEILSVLGEGAFGTVYKAHDPQLDRDVAVKVPRFGALQGPEDRERFLREARSAANLHQAHICPVHEVGTVDGRDYIVMAFIDGKPLSKVLQTQNKLTDKQVVSVIRKLALALEEAHQKGIIHRDLKPANIMINRKGEPVIMDFGLARRSNSGDAQISQSGQILGTPAYMSPEQARGDGKSVGPAADVYSLGVIFYEMLCGRRPFEGTVTEVIGQILHVEAEPPSLHRPGVDPRLEAICLKAVAKKPAERFASMKDFAAALAEYTKSASTVAPKAEPTVARDDEAALHTDQFARLIEAVSSDFEEKVERAARRAVRKSRKSQKIKVPWWTYLVGSGLMGLVVLFGIFFFIRKDTVTVIVNIPIENINDPSLSFLLDDKPIAAEAFAKPIDLKPGEHELIVNKDGKQYRRFLFNVGKGDNEPVIVQDVTPKTDAPELALERLQGRWIAVEQSRGGAKLAADELKAENKVMTIQGDRFSIEYQLPANRAQRGAETGTIARIDPSVSPAEIDMVFERGEAGPVHFKGIFALDGNRLVHCYRKCAEDEGDCERPRDYATVRGQPVFHVVYERASAGPRRVEVKELNLTGYDTHPWISTDGKRVYFESRKPDNEPEPSMWIYSASRPDARTPFSGKQALFSGRHPTLTGDELEMVFIRGPQGNASLRVARRNSSNETFVSAGEISELKDQVNPKSPALSEDGLTLVFQRGRDEQKTVEFVFCVRTDRNASWSKPQTLPVTADPAWTEPLTWPFLSRDGLTLWYCHGGGKTPDIRMATRPDVQSPFGNHQPVIVEGTPLVGRSPRFVQATSELFYSPNLTDTQGDWSLWVVKDYAPLQFETSDDPLIGDWDWGWGESENGKEPIYQNEITFHADGTCIGKIGGGRGRWERSGNQIIISWANNAKDTVIISKDGRTLDGKNKEGNVPVRGRKKLIDGWVNLFNGKDLTGWKTLPSLPGGWTVENGLLTGRTKDLAYLFSERGDYSDFHLRAECRTNRFGNGGIFFRSPFALDRNKGRHPSGYEAQIIHEHPKDFANLTGSLLIAESGRQPLHKERRKLAKHDEWFTMEVIARGKQLLVKINGDVVAQATDDGFSQGHISLQCLKDQDTKADDPTSLVQFRKIDIKEFGKESPPAAASNIPADRIAADAVLAHGGQVTIELANGDRRDVDAVSKLPDDPFQVVFAGVPPGATATAGYLSTLKDLKGLRSVLLHSPPFSDRDFEILAAIPNLQSFNLGASKLDGSGFRLLRGSANIRHITLWGESQIDDQALADIGSLPNLELLAFSSPRVTAAGLRALKPLARLRALTVGANFDSEMVAAIGECEQLTELLVLGGTGITDADLRLLSRLTRLPNLWIGQPKVTDAGVQTLGVLSQLTSLHVTNSRITPAVTTSLNSLVNLKELSLNDSNLKGIDFSTLKLPLAATVSLARCRLRDDDLRGLDGLPRLQTLVLSGNPLTDASIDEFAKITTLRSILLDGTGITRQGVERLKNLRAELTVRGVP